MFGNPMQITLDGLTVTLRPPKRTEMEAMAELFSSMEVQWYLQVTYAVTPENELEWWDKINSEVDSVQWGIVINDGGEKLIGFTGLHRIHPFWGSCTSGIVIAAKEYWGKGIAYRSHLARTWYAANWCNRASIQSEVLVPNKASLKALLKVGYRVSGEYDRNIFRGVYMDTCVLSWVNPRLLQILYPEGTPEKLTDSLAKAHTALDLADQVVTKL